MREPLKWYDANATDNPRWIKALAEVRHLAPREGWCYQHVQAIIVAIGGRRSPYLNGGLFSGRMDVPHFSRIARSYLLRIGNLDCTKINPDIFASMSQLPPVVFAAFEALSLTDR
jgi:hypothetical protein